MPKRRPQDSDYLDAQDSPIGLTEAFAAVKGPQSVDYDENDDPVGLTQAFGAVPEPDEPHAWDKAGKWADFDWDAESGESGAPAEEAGLAEAETAVEASVDPDPDVEAVPDNQADPADPVDSSGAQGGAPASEKARKKGSGRGRHAAHERELSPRMKRSKKVRRVLIALAIVLILAVAAVGFFWYRTWTGSQQEAAQQAQEQTEAPDERQDIADAPAADAVEATAKLADVPDLSGLLGRSQDEAIASIGRGALITANAPVNEEDNPIRTNLTVSLSDEPADSKTGTPTVYLGLGEDGAVRQAGYSASASALGFGALSFADAVSAEHVVEKTLARAGVAVGEGAAALPQNKDEYSTYASDGTTVVRERCSFEGDADVNGIPCQWSAVLSYDYTTQVVTGNLNDTVRIIYVYITAK